MNGFKEIQEYIRNFICEKVQMQQQIADIEQQRTQLAEKRNAQKQIGVNYIEVNELGKKISELGNKSQELQNKLDYRVREVKTQVNLAIDNLVVEGIRKIRISNDEIECLNTKIGNQMERNIKYHLQKQEFYLRFGRMPELSERAKKENKSQEEQIARVKLEINEMIKKIEEMQQEISDLASIKNELKKGNWNVILEKEDNKEVSVEELIAQETAVIAELYGMRTTNREVSVEELIAQETAVIAELYGMKTINREVSVEDIIVQEIDDIEEIYLEDLYVEDFAPIEEIEIEEFKPEEIIVEEFVPVEEISIIDEIEELARNIVEEIVVEQTRDFNVNKIEEDIIIFEQEENVPKSKTIIPLFGQRATIANITIKFENANLVYKAQMSDGEEIKIYPAQLGEESVLLRDKQNREECKEILTNYAISEHKILDKKVVNKIDPLICELLIECAERYGHNAQELVYNYATSFSEGDTGLVPEIVYNLSYMEQSNLSRKERVIINKICKNARKNIGIDVIESFTGFKKLKYVFKRLFAINNVNVLPEAKY